MPGQMEIKIVLQLPLKAENFGGVVGNRVSLQPWEKGMSRLVMQIAYLEKGQGARVRYLEHETPVVFADDGSPGTARLKSMREFEGPEKNVLLELNITCD